MEFKRTVYRQFRSAMPTLIKLYVPILAILAGIVLLRIFRDVKTSDMTRDPAQITGSHPFTGLLSNLGILFWCSSAAICFFCAAIIRKDSKDHNYASFLFSSGLITSLLLIDDLFMFHDFVLPTYFHMHESSFYIVYLVLIVVFLLAFRRIILGTNYSILCLALIFFVISMMFDFAPVRLLGHWVFEDGCKFFGIVTWMYYFTQVGFRCMNFDHKSVDKTGRKTCCS